MNKTLIAMLAGSALAATLAIAQDTAKPTEAKPSWTDSLTLKGDVRFRLEYIDKEGSDDRERARIRARLAAEGKVNDEVSAGIGIATGDGDPVSSNESLDGGFSSKDFNLNLAYIDLHPELLQGGNIILGKMKQPFIAVNDLQWDSDLNPEGAALQLELPAGDTLALLVNGGGFWVEERSEDDETMLYGGQVAVALKGDVKATVGASYFFYDNIQGYAPIYDAEDSFGNTTVDVIDPVSGEVTGIVYAEGYEIAELFAEVGFDAGLPVVISGNYLVNQDADEDDTAYMVGVKAGKLKKQGDVEFGYSYRELEADSVLGVYADSDSFGGGTDGKTHKITLGYQIGKNLAGNLTYFTGQAGLDDGKDYDRVQVDLVAKF